jgi:hypothetical protein
MPAGLDLIEGLGLVGIEAGDAALLQSGTELGIYECGDLGIHSVGGWLMMNGADGGIGVAMLGLEVRHHRFQRFLVSDGQFPGGIGKT